MTDIRMSQMAGIPFGNNAGRPANATIGQPYFNGQEQRLEIYAGTGWQNIVSETPGVVSISGSYLQSLNSGTITITGTNFTTGAIATAIGTNGVEINASSTVVNSIVSVTAVFSGLSEAYEPYDIKVTNTSNLYGILPDILYVNQSPVWNTPAGSLGSYIEQINITLSALSATDPESTTVTYALANGSTLPAGVSLNSSTGVISGTLPDISSNTTYNFIINASDGENISPRSFSIVSIPDMTVEYLVVGGGGSAPSNNGGGVGGGGAGGFLSGSTLLSSIGSSPVTVTVGAGGASASNQIIGNNGQNSVFKSFIAIGGGAGSCSAANGGNAGGSGGGGGEFNGAQSTGGTGTPGQGNNGGQGTGTGTNAGGGGGGAGSAGGNGDSANGSTPARQGGAGLPSSITGTQVYYAGGGGASGNNRQGGNGGIGGGGGGGAGSGGSNSSQGYSAGTPNTGGGGGGTYTTPNPYGGGSGVVVLAYPNTFPAISNISNTLTYDQPTRAGYRVYRFTAGTGTITF